MTHLRGRVSWHEYVNVAKLLGENAYLESNDVVRKINYLSEEFMRQLEKFSDTHVQRLRKAIPSCKLDQEKHCFTYGLGHDNLLEEVLGNTKRAIWDRDYGYLRAVLNVNLNEPYRLYYGSCGTQDNFALGRLLHNFLIVYIRSNLFNLLNISGADEDWSWSERLGYHDGDDHVVKLFDVCEQNPDFQDEEFRYNGCPKNCTATKDIGSLSKILFEYMYLTVAFLRAGSDHHWAEYRGRVVDDLGFAIRYATHRIPTLPKPMDKPRRTAATQRSKSKRATMARCMRAH